MQLHIFAHQADLHAALRVLDPPDHLLPFVQRRRGRLQPQLPADDGGKAALLQHQRRFIKAGKRDVFDDAVGLHIAEQGDLPEDRVLQRLVAAEHDDIRADAHALQLLDGMLGGLGFVLVGAMQKRHQGDMNKEAVFPADLQRDLSHCFDEGLGFNVTDGAADLRDDDIRLGLVAHAVNKILDLICDMRDDLHGGAKIFAPALLVEHVPVDLSCGQVGKAVQVFVDESLVVPQIQVGLRAVLRHIDLSVLIGTHGAGVHVDIGIQLLGRHLQAAGLQKPPQRGRGDALAQAGDHAARHKNILCHLVHSFDLYPNIFQKIIKRPSGKKPLPP